MKRFLLGLIILGGLSLMAAPQARAQALCGHSYAMLLSGADPNFTPDGPNTEAFGVGAVQFGALEVGGNFAITGINELAGAPGTTVVADTAATDILVGDNVVVAGVTPAGFNGTVTVTSISPGNYFTYTAATSGLGSGTGGNVTVGGGCAATGELIYNAGDVQEPNQPSPPAGTGLPGNANGQESPVGEFFGPANCFSDYSGLGGVPCFDGGNSFTGGTLSPGGPGGSYILSFLANYEYFDTTDGLDLYGAIPFGFFVQIGKSAGIGLGTAISDPATNSPALPGNGAPILSLTLSEQDTLGMPGTTFGDAPFAGSSILSCTAWGANSTDGVATSIAASSANQGTGITGALETTLGSYVIFNSTQADGELSFNSNNGYVVPSSGPIPNNLLCPFALIPQNAGPLGAYYLNSASTSDAIFADGSANFFSGIEASAANPDCEDALNSPGVGYADSSVQFGSTDQDAYVIVTGYFTSTAYFTPVGGESYCVSYQQGNANALKTAAKSPAASTGTTTLAPVQVENNNEALCDTETTMALNSATTSYTHGSGANTESWNTTCTVALAGGTPFDAAAVGPSTAAQTVAETTCTCVCSGFVGTGTYASGSCSAAQGPTTTSSTVSIASEACPMPVTTFPITCKN